MIVSLCTVCKNRAHHYKQTILKNIHDHQTSGNVEFLLLDYNSDDDLEQWVKKNLIGYIESGLLSYYKTFDPQYFHRSHSRNMAFRLAKGDLICNVDADNYTGHSFAAYLREEFIAADNNVFVCAGGENDAITCSDIGGRICIHSKDFDALGGYDEEMSDYGFEDYDFIHRLEMNNLKKSLISNQNYLEAIKHDSKDRISEEFTYRNIKDVMFHHISPSVSKILLLFLDDTFVLGTLIDNESATEKPTVRIKNTPYGRISLEEEHWVKGAVEKCGPEDWIFLSDEAKVIYNLSSHSDKKYYRLINETGDFEFHKTDDPEIITMAVLFYSEMYNKIKMKQNKNKKIIKPNKMPVGAGVVYKNFNYDQPIVL